jgi:hypothetical protein
VVLIGVVIVIAVPMVRAVPRNVREGEVAGVARAGPDPWLVGLLTRKRRHDERLCGP